MLPIGGKHLLWYQLKLAQYFGFNEIIINLHKNSEVVTSYFGDGRKLGVKIFYAFEDKLLGTAGAIKAAESFLGKDTFLVMYGDTLVSVNLANLLDWHKAKGGVATILLYETREPWSQGVVRIDKDGQILDLVEKPPKGLEPSNLANAGVGFFEPKIFAYIPSNQFVDFGFDVFPVLVKQEKVYGVKDKAYVQDIGTPQRYQKARIDFEAGLVKFPFEIGD